MHKKSRVATEVTLRFINVECHGTALSFIQIFYVFNRHTGQFRNVLYGHPFDYRWRNKTVVTKAERTAAGYRVSGSIALTELKCFGIAPERFWMGAFRADFKNGGELAGWYSYLPHPSGRANFHVPQMFFPVASAVPWP